MDRRKMYMAIMLVLPHEVNPGELGLAKDCKWCKEVVVSEKARTFIDLLKLNGGHMFSPSKDPDLEGHYRSFLQEKDRAVEGVTAGSKPDELLPYGETSYGRIWKVRCRTVSFYTLLHTHKHAHTLVYST
jgi:hypothetical protein